MRAKSTTSAPYQRQALTAQRQRVFPSFRILRRHTLPFGSKCGARLGTLVLALVASWGLSAVADAQTGVNEEAHREFVFAYNLLQHGEDDLAADKFDDYLKKYPNDEKRGDALYYRAMLAQRTGRPDDAQRLLGQISGTTIVPGHAVQLLAGQVHLDRRQFDQAVTVLEAVNLKPLPDALKASVHLMRGSAYRGAGNLQAAEAQFDAAAKLDTPMRAAALLDLARTKARMEKTGEALTRLDRAIELNSATVTPEAARLAGDLAYKAGDHRRAMGYYRVIATGHQSSPHYAQAVLGIMWSQLALRQYDAVIQTYDRYLKSLPAIDRVTAIYLAGTAHQEMGRHDEAIKAFGAILDGAPGNALEDKVLYKLATSYFEKRNWQPMTEAVRELEVKHPKSALMIDGQFLLAAADVKQNQAERGAARLTRLINEGAESPYYGQALLQRGRLYENAAASDSEAREDYLRAAAADYRTFVSAADKGVKVADDGVVHALLRLAELRYRLEDFEAAEQAAARLLKRKKLDPVVEQEALYRASMARIHLNRRDEAVAALDTLLKKHPRNRFMNEARYYRGVLNVARDQAGESVTDLLAAGADEDLPATMRINALRLAGLTLRQAGEDDRAAVVLSDLEDLVQTENLSPEETLWLAKYKVERATEKSEYQVIIRDYLMPLIDKKNAERIAAATRAEAAFVTAVSIRGIAGNDMDELRKAVGIFDLVSELGQGFGARARMEKARTYVMMNELENAIREYETLLSLPLERLGDPTVVTSLYESAKVYRRLAPARRARNNPQGAAEALKQARSNLLQLAVGYKGKEHWPNPQLAWIELADMAEEAGNTAQAIKHLEALRDEYAKTPYSDFAKALLEYHDGQPAVAEQLLVRLRDAKEPEAALMPHVRRWITRLQRERQEGA